MLRLIQYGFGILDPCGIVALPAVYFFVGHQMSKRICRIDCYRCSLVRLHCIAYQNHHNLWNGEWQDFLSERVKIYSYSGRVSCVSINFYNKWHKEEEPQSVDLRFFFFCCHFSTLSSSSSEPFKAMLTSEGSTGSCACELSSDCIWFSEVTDVDCSSCNKMEYKVIGISKQEVVTAKLLHSTLL